MIGFEQQLAIAGLLRERHQFAGAVARQRRLAAQIGVDPEAPFGLEGGRAVAELLADLAGLGIGRFGLDALQAVRDDRRRTELQPELQLPAQPVLRRHGFGELETRREMRDRFHIGRAAHGLVAGAHAVIASESEQPRFAEMIGQQFRLAARRRRQNAAPAPGRRARAIRDGASATGFHRRRHAPARA